MEAQNEKIDLYIIGAGGLGREVQWHITENPEFLERFNLVGFIDDLQVAGTMINGLEIVGSTKDILDIDKEIAVIIAIGNPKIRKSKYDTICHKKNIIFPNIVAKDVRLSKTVHLGQGNIIMSDAIFTVNIEIGDFNLIYLNCTITHDVKIHNFVSLYSAVNVSGTVSIGDFSEIGTGVKIIQNINIGPRTIIGAGAVVISDCEGDVTLVGVPAKPNKEKNLDVIL